MTEKKIKKKKKMKVKDAKIGLKRKKIKYENGQEIYITRQYGYINE